MKFGSVRVSKQEWMRWLTINLLKVATALAVLSFISVLVVWLPVAVAEARPGAIAHAVSEAVDATPTVDATVTALNKEKLQHENDWLWNYGATIITSLFSTLALAAAGIFTVVRYFNDRRDAREKQEAEAKRLAEDRKAEREKRDEERFQKVVEGLGSESIEARVGAAITLRTFLRPGYEPFYLQAFDLAVAHLRLRKAGASALGSPISSAQILIAPKEDLRQKQQSPPPAAIPLDSLSQALITVFKESFPLARDELKKKTAQFDPQLLDASNSRLDNAYLVDADLAEAWLLRASLREANLGRTQLKGANLIGARLEAANLSYAHCKAVRLKGAQFKGASLIYAQLKGADPEDAASLKDTKMNLVIGLTPEQLEACKAKGAIVDEDRKTSTPASFAMPPQPSS